MGESYNFCQHWGPDQNGGRPDLHIKSAKWDDRDWPLADFAVTLAKSYTKLACAVQEQISTGRPEARKEAR
jgi:hypothetical protein